MVSHRSPDHTLVTSPKAEDMARPMNAIRTVVRALRINTRAIELQAGISLAQLFVLQQLAERPAESLNELAERTATHQSSVSVVVRRLVERGLVSRTAAPADRRRIHIALTPAGEQMLKGAPPTVQSQLIHGLERMADEPRKQLGDLLDAWLQASGLEVAETPAMLFEDEAEAGAGSV